MNYKLIKIYYQFHFFNMNSIQTILQQYNVDGQITGLPQDKLVEILALIRKPKTLKKTKRENNPLCKKHKIAIAMRLGINTKDTHKQSICGGKNCHNRSYCDIGCTGCPGIEIENEEIARAAAITTPPAAAAIPQHVFSSSRTPKRENNPLCKKHKTAIAMSLGINKKDTHKQSICGGENCHHRSYCDIDCTGCPGIKLEKEEIARADAAAAKSQQINNNIWGLKEGEYWIV
jgi:hypothetical protein